MRILTQDPENTERERKPDWLIWIAGMCGSL